MSRSEGGRERRTYILLAYARCDGRPDFRQETTEKTPAVTDYSPPTKCRLL